MIFVIERLEIINKRYEELNKQLLDPENLSNIKLTREISKEISDLGLENIEVVPIIYEGTDKSKIDKLLAKADSLGWEGLMLNKDTKWKNKSRVLTWNATFFKILRCLAYVLHYIYILFSLFFCDVTDIRQLKSCRIFIGY